jgi:hypothetical protein
LVDGEKPQNQHRLQDPSEATLIHGFYKISNSKFETVKRKCKKFFTPMVEQKAQNDSTETLQRTHPSMGAIGHIPQREVLILIGRVATFPVENLYDV